MVQLQEQQLPNQTMCQVRPHQSTSGPTQSSNNVVGAPQSSNIEAAAPALQTNSVGTPTTFSSSPSSPLANLVPSNPN